MTAERLSSPRSSVDVASPTLLKTAESKPITMARYLVVVLLLVVLVCIMQVRRLILDSVNLFYRDSGDEKKYNFKQFLCRSEQSLLLCSLKY